MLTSFKRTEGAAPAAITDTVQAPVTPVLKESHDHEETSLSSLPSRPLEGEFLPEDFVLPRLNLVQSVGPLSETFQPGAFVYNKEVTLTDGTQPVSLTVLRIRKQYQEYVPYGGEEMPRVLMTVIRFCITVEDHALQKLLMFYYEAVRKYDAQGKLLPEMILVWCVRVRACTFTHGRLAQRVRYGTAFACAAPRVRARAGRR